MGHRERGEGDGTKREVTGRDTRVVREETERERGAQREVAQTKKEHSNMTQRRHREGVTE